VLDGYPKRAKPPNTRPRPPSRGRPPAPSARTTALGPMATNVAPLPWALERHPGTAWARAGRFFMRPLGRHGCAPGRPCPLRGATAGGGRLLTRRRLAAEHGRRHPNTQRRTDPPSQRSKVDRQTPFGPGGRCPAEVRGKCRPDGGGPPNSQPQGRSRREMCRRWGGACRVPGRRPAAMIREQSLGPHGPIS